MINIDEEGFCTLPLKEKQEVIVGATSAGDKVGLLGIIASELAEINERLKRNQK